MSQSWVRQVVGKVHYLIYWAVWTNPHWGISTIRTPVEELSDQELSSLRAKSIGFIFSVL